MSSIFFQNILQQYYKEVTLQLVRSKCMPIVLYGLECFSVAKADIKSLDFAVTRFLMKLFRTTNIDVIEKCRLFVNFLLPSEMLELRRTKFEWKLMNGSNVLNYFVLGLTAWNVQLLCYIYSLVKLVKFLTLCYRFFVFPVNKDRRRTDWLLAISRNWHLNIKQVKQSLPYTAVHTGDRYRNRSSPSHSHICSRHWSTPYTVFL